MPTNPFDIDTGSPQNQGLLASAATAPQQQAVQAAPAAQIAAPQAAQTQQAAQTRAGQVATATAQQAAVDPATQTVQGQLAGILASGSPLLVQAQTRAKQDANKRGLLNSSMAVGAGESALYDAAMPIASQDASTYADFGLSNADRQQQTELANAAARNDMERLNVSEEGTTGRFNAGETNTAARQASDLQAQTASQNAQLQQQTSLENARLQQQAASGNQDAQTRLMLQQMDADTRVEMTNIEANYRTLMQASQSASDLYQQTLKNMSDIVANRDMNAEAKNAAIAQQKDFLRNGMALIGAMNNLGIEELMDFGGGGAGEPTPGTNQPPERVVNPRQPQWGDPDFSGGV